MRCPHCGMPTSHQETTVDGCRVIQWLCVNGCGEGGQAPVCETPIDTQIEARRDARHGPDPLTLDKNGLPY